MRPILGAPSSTYPRARAFPTISDEAQAGVFRRFHPALEMRVIPKAGHWAMYENPDACIRTVRELLAQPLRQR